METLPTPERLLPDFSTVPALIREHGRARGFERLRDIVLDRPEAMGSESLLPVLKLVIELDRHALFSEVSEAKVRDRMDRDAWEKFQEYLHGEPVSDESPKPKGKKHDKRQSKTDRTPIRESEGVIRELRGADSAGQRNDVSEGRLSESGDSQGQ